MDKNEVAQLGLAFAVGVSLSAGYVFLGAQVQGDDPAVVVVQERCPEVDEDEGAARTPAGALELASLPGEQPVPEGVSIWVGLDGLWLDRGPEQGEPLLELDRGRFALRDVERGRVPALLDAIAEPSSKTAVLWIDHRVPGQTLIELIASLARLGFGDYAFAVEGNGAGPRAYAFVPARYGDPKGSDEQWSLGLSLRVSEYGGVAAWAHPQVAGQVRRGGTAALPLDLGEGECMLAERELPSSAAVAELEHALCQFNTRTREATLGVEFVVARKRSVGEFLRLRDRDSRAGECAGPSYISGPYERPANECAAALPFDAMLTHFDEAEPGNAFRSPKAQIIGQLEKDQIRTVVRANIDGVRRCYNDALRSELGLAGTVVVEFVIDEDGTVRDSIVGSGTDLGSIKTEQCIAEAAKDWVFPKPSKGTVKVTYPFNLSPG